jgi:hypothetical protein
LCSINTSYQFEQPSIIIEEERKDLEKKGLRGKKEGALAYPSRI